MSNYTIYHKIHFYLDELNYDNASIKEKYDIVRQALFKCYIEKIEELGLEIETGNYDYQHIEALCIEMYGKIVDRDDFFSSCVYCILGIVRDLQKSPVIWIKTTDIGDPTINFNQNGKWNELITGRNIPYLTAMIVALRTFQSILPDLNKDQDSAIILDLEFE